MGQQGLYDFRTEHDACGVGFVVDLAKSRSHATVQKALTVLANLQHRGAVGSDPQTGDGAGILFGLDDEFFRAVADSHELSVLEGGSYGVGMFFLPQGQNEQASCRRLCEACVETEGLEVHGWREVPINLRALGTLARESMPNIVQLFVGVSKEFDARQVERKLYVLRRMIEKRIGAELPEIAPHFHIASLSSQTIVYKGLLLAEQLPKFYLDLNDDRLRSKFAVVHQRYSTNTFPSWSLAHPFRYLAHNGEINTLRGNLNWMHAREAQLRDAGLVDIEKIAPIIPDGLSDSGSLDASVEFLYHTGRSLAHCMAMLIPEAWEHDTEMSATKRAFYEYHSFGMEPWDGPASIVFTDGRQLGAVLDRNGLRPSRYTVTHDGFVVLASETGTLGISPRDVAYHARLEPGTMLLIDLEAGRIVPDAEIKEALAGEQPYAAWIRSQSTSIPLKSKDAPEVKSDDASQDILCAFGYTEEQLQRVLAPMATSGDEPIGSMGADTPQAVFSRKRPLLYGYFRQLFAQVTNPPLDAIREVLVTSLRVTLGATKSIAYDSAEHCRKIVLERPIISVQQLEQILSLGSPGIMTQRISLLYRFGDEEIDTMRHFRLRLEKIQTEVLEAVARGATIVVLSDRGMTRGVGALPALLACSAVHHRLLREGKRMECSIVIESAEPREVHHFATLVGYGASAVCPYLALSALRYMLETKRFPKTHRLAQLQERYLYAANKGLRKVLSKMGISTVQSYCGAQIFEAFGLADEFIEQYFPGTASRIGGAGLGHIARETIERNASVLRNLSLSRPTLLETGGEYNWRRDGEEHLNDPIAVATLQQAVRQNSASAFSRYSARINEQNTKFGTLRGLLAFQMRQPPIPLEDVESVESIVRRFKTGAMSFGSISFEAHATLAIAMNRLGGRSNTGEGGEDPIRYRDFSSHEEMVAAFGEISPLIASVLRVGDSARSAIKQVASARFGVTSAYLVNADELQIKMAQGAKPGEGGQLPGHKVDEWIAKVRHSTPGVGLISPPPHHDIYSIEDLAQLIHDLKCANDRADISVKLVSEVGVGTIAAGVAKGKADVILISGADGGTGASPLTSIKYAGLPWELGLSEAHQVLVMNKLRNRVRLEVDGQLKTGRDVAIAALLGAEEFGFATAPLISSGCVMMRKCHLNTCSVGVATQDPRLRAKFSGRPEYVVNFMRFVAQELREIMAMLGFRRIQDMVGRVDCLRMLESIAHPKVDELTLSRMLYQPPVESQSDCIQTKRQDHKLGESLDRTALFSFARPAFERGARVYEELAIRNIHRSVGIQLGSEITRRFGSEGLPEDSIFFRFHGSAGQSFGAFIPPGLTLAIDGDANDYVGKGLSGGKILITPPTEATFAPERNIIIGNVALYGATSGEAYIRGLAGERFAVRNSGARAVVEGVGAHGCEYMTGGCVVVLGPVGRNFAAGMSGGIAYVLNESGTFERFCNTELVDVEAVGEADGVEELRELLERHVLYTESKIARRLLEHWELARQSFVRVIGREYKRVRAQELMNAPQQVVHA